MPRLPAHKCSRSPPLQLRRLYGYGLRMWGWVAAARPFMLRRIAWPGRLSGRAVPADQANFPKFVVHRLPKPMPCPAAQGPGEPWRASDVQRINGHVRLVALQASTARGKAKRLRRAAVAELAGLPAMCRVSWRRLA